MARLHLPNRQPKGGADDSRAAPRLLTGWLHTLIVFYGLKADFHSS